MRAVVFGFADKRAGQNARDFLGASEAGQFHNLGTVFGKARRGEALCSGSCRWASGGELTLTGTNRSPAQATSGGMNVSCTKYRSRSCARAFGAAAPSGPSSVFQRQSCQLFQHAHLRVVPADEHSVGEGVEVKLN